MATKKRKRRRKVGVKRNFRDPTAVRRFLLYLFAQRSHLGGAWRNNVFPTSIFKDCLLCVRMGERRRRRSNNHKRNSPLIGLSIKPTDGVFPPVLLFIGPGATRVLLGGTAGVHDSQSYVKIKKKEIESQLVFKEILSIYFFVPLRCCHSVNSIGLS
ncbi:hypothetical protein DAPPUDRAFT_308421 [Daphnia pulex]|uniref:Uncharacterized protein n=1 Tax=Daphnia pulex TaxID=6669 RepID=E9G236_DAPPU|nr:hypothetical protein DAPPUDRAFT_308421 [Daphnia pulex]|eukprot:EFX86178.1 hypothetical protein DAPPUDRAFT_308421 [Daphnia pulex]